MKAYFPLCRCQDRNEKWPKCTNPDKSTKTEDSESDTSSIKPVRNDKEDMNCDQGWKKMPFGPELKCYKYIGAEEWVEFASKQCENVDAKLPLPTNMEEVKDLLRTMSAFGIPKGHVLLDVEMRKTVALVS